MKTFKELLNEGYQRVTENQKTKDLGYRGDDLFEMRDSYESSLINVWFPETAVVIFYKDEDGDAAINHFVKINDKFEDCEFIDDNDKEVLAKIVGRYDAKGEPIQLGDTVLCRGTIGRVVWLHSEFYIYDPMKDENVMPLSDDSKMTKLN